MNELIIDSSAIVPIVGLNQTQMVFQRHCAYDNVNGGLTDDSRQQQEEIVRSFMEMMGKDNVKNTYFLFTASDTVSSGDFKRCVETTNVVMNLVRTFYEDSGVSIEHIMNLNSPAYKLSVHESGHITEPGMFTDDSGYFDFLREKYGGVNSDFWIDFEGDLSKQKREQFGSEGPDEIVQRGIHYINILQRYAELFHIKYPDSRLIIWSGTHYDLISPLVKQKILNWDKSDYVGVDNCGGISLIVDDTGRISANVNGALYPFDSQYSKPPQLRS